MARTNTPKESGEVDAAVDRNAIKSRLDELGVEYNNRAQTGSLQELLADAEAGGVTEEELAPLEGTETHAQEELPTASTPKQIENPVASRASAPVVSASSRRGGKILIANQHTGPIALPRKSAEGVVLPAILLPSASCTPIDAALWAEYKKQQMIRHYLDHKLLAEVPAVGPVPVLSDTTSSPNIPEHLQTEKEQGAYADASVTKEEGGEVIV